MKLTNKLKTGILATSLIAALGTPGYATADNGGEAAFWGSVLINRGVKKNNPSAIIFGDGLRSYGNAKAGRSKTNIYVNPNRDGRNYQSRNRYIIDPTKVRGRHHLSANYWKDFDGNGKMTINELTGIKNKFQDNEEIVLFRYDNSFFARAKPRELVSEIYSPKGELIDTYKSTKEDLKELRPKRRYAKRFHRGVKEIDKDGGSLMSFLLKKGGYGNYRVVWKHKGKYSGSNEFKIVPSSRSKEKHGMMFTYEKWVDSNKDGIRDIGELTNIKVGEPQERSSSKPFHFQVSGPKKGLSTLKIINKDTGKILFDKTLIQGGTQFGPEKPTLYKPGTYVGKWFRNGKLTSQLEVKVVNDNKVTKK